MKKRILKRAAAMTSMALALAMAAVGCENGFESGGEDANQSGGIAEASTAYLLPDGDEAPAGRVVDNPSTDYAMPPGAETCSAYLVANIRKAAGETKVLTAEDLTRAPYWAANGLDWGKACEGSYVTYEGPKSVSTQAAFETLYNAYKPWSVPYYYYIGILVYYGKEHEGHWVGVKGMDALVTIDGKGYIKITPTSVNDSVVGNSLRDGAGWKWKGGEIYVPYDCLTKEGFRQVRVFKN